MKNAGRLVALFLSVLFILTLLPAAPARAAEEYGDWEFEIISGKAEITGYSGSASTVSVPSSISGYTVASIGEYAFSGSSTLTEVTIPNSVTVIRYGAFEGCEKLKTVNLGSGVKTIEEIAFRECPLLTNITFKEGLLSLEDEAFMNTGLASVTLPKSLTSIDGNPFANCSKLKSFTVTSGNGSYKVKSGCIYTKDETELVAYPAGSTAASFTIPSGTATVGISAFGGAENLTSVTIPSSVKKIGGFAFSECFSLKSVSLPSGLTTLDNYAFSYCSSLTTLAIPASTDSVGYGVTSMSGITSFTVASGNTTYSASGGVLYNKAQTKLISYPAGKTAADFTAASKVTVTGEYAFVDCTHLTTISLPGLKTMGEGTFSGCSALKNFEFPSTVTKIPDSAFEFCFSLKSVTIPAQITSIGGWAYYMCENLTSVKIPATVKTIGENVFSECSSSLKISCESGSAAHTYAKNEGIAFVLTDIVAPKITTQPSAATVATGSSAVFKVVASGIGLTYQWQYSTDGGKTYKNSTLDGYDTAKLTVGGSKVRNGFYYRCVVKNDGGSATSSGAKLTVMDKPEITAQPASATVALNNTANFKVTATGSGISYQWQYSSDNGKTWQNSTMSGYDTATLPVKGIESRNGVLYRCVVKNAVGSATSSSAKLTVSGVKPAIRTQPASATSAVGSTVNFTVKAAGTGLSYQWQYSSDGGSTWQNSTMDGNKTATLPVKGIMARNGVQYRCVVKNSYGSTVSSAAKLTVMEKPSITSQPSSATVALNGTAKFTVGAKGSSLKYQWQYSSDGGKTWQNSTMTGYNTSSLPVGAIESRNGLTYRCVVKNAVGSVTSNAATLTVSGVKPTIRIQPASASVDLGNTVNFTVKAAGAGLSYQWQYSSDGGKTWQNSTMSGYNTATLPVKGIAARNGLYYRCVVKNAYGSATSSAAKLTVK